MENLYIEGSDSLPTVQFNTDGLLKITGRALPENAFELFSPLIAWVKEFSIDEVNLEHMKNGEYLRGKYFWKKNMVLVDECSLKAIEPVIDDLIEEGDFQDAFEEI